MKKIGSAITTISMLAGILVAVACDKDREASTLSVNNSFCPYKVSTISNQLRNAMMAFYSACDRAYHNDSTAFLSICDNNDTADFIRVTGVSSQMLLDFQALVLQELENFCALNPTYTPGENNHKEYANSPLSTIGALSGATSGHLSDLYPSSLTEYDYYNMMDAILMYAEEDSPFVITTSICALLGAYFTETSQDYLNDELVVAEMDGELEEGLSLPLTFNETLFKQRYETALGEMTGNKWVAEEVKVYLHEHEDELVPVLKIAAYNADKEYGSSLFIVTNTSFILDGNVAIVGRSSLVLECIGSGACADWNGGCNLDLTGIPDCTNCTTTGSCEKRKNPTPKLFASLSIIYDLLH